MTIRRLTSADAAEWRTLRLRALREEPEAFLSSPEDEERNSLADTERRFREKWSLPDNAVFGAFRDGRLAGNLGIFREDRIKTRHKAVVWGMYVAPEARRLGLGRGLVEAAIDLAATLPDLEQVLLIVTSENRAAVELYRALGFLEYGREPRAVKVGGRYLDELAMVYWLKRP